MGKTARWFRGLLGLKKDESPSQSAAATTRSEPKSGKKRWSFVKSYREKERTGNNSGCRKASNGGELPPASRDGSLDPNKHAIAVAAATAAVADAAVAAAQAAAAVVKMTSSARSNAAANTKAYVSGASYGNREEWAAVKIQAHFRAYLSRRALRALKALVKLQALVRGHIVRKQTADMLRRMQVLLRAQARACAGRAQISEPLHSSSKSSQNFHPGPATPEKFEHAIRAKIMKHDQISTLKRNGSKSVGRSIVDQYKTNDGRNWLDCGMDGGSKDQEIFSMKTSPDDGSFDKILKIDNGKHHFVPKRRNHFQSSHRPLASDQNSQSFTTSKDSTTHQTIPSPSSGEVQSLGPKFTPDAEESSFCTADDSPQFYSASSRGGGSTRGPFTPTKSDDSRSYLSSYPDHPNYMAYTESSRAKMRSLSAPKQRPQFERSSSALRYSVRGYDDSRWSTQRVSALHANFTSKAYPGSGRLDRLGLPVIGGSFGSNAGHWHS